MTNSARLATPANIVWLVIYLMTMAGLVGGLFATRNWALESFDSPQSKEEWRRWQEETLKQAEGEGPVLRRPARSAEPPTVVLLRDYFVTCLALALLLSSVLFLTLMFMIRGVFRGGPQAAG